MCIIPQLAQGPVTRTRSTRYRYSRYVCHMKHSPSTSILSYIHASTTACIDELLAEVPPHLTVLLCNNSRGYTAGSGCGSSVQKDLARSTHRNFLRTTKVEVDVEMRYER